MMDFLKHFPFITIEQYHWQLTIPQIRIMLADAPREIFLSEKQSKKQKLINQREQSVTLDEQIENEDFLNDLGMPIFE